MARIKLNINTMSVGIDGADDTISVQIDARVPASQSLVFAEMMAGKGHKDFDIVLVPKSDPAAAAKPSSRALLEELKASAPALFGPGTVLLPTTPALAPSEEDGPDEFSEKLGAKLKEMAHQREEKQRINAEKLEQEVAALPTTAPAPVETGPATQDENENYGTW